MAAILREVSGGTPARRCSRFASKMATLRFRPATKKETSHRTEYSPGEARGEAWRENYAAKYDRDPVTHVRACPGGSRAERTSQHTESTGSGGKPIGPRTDRSARSERHAGHASLRPDAG